ILYYCLSTAIDEWLMGRKERGPVSILIAIGCIGTWQTQLEAHHFMQVRGCLMIMAMKLISFSFDDENCSITTRIAYVFNPSTVLFGPFISFRMFKKILLAPVSSLRCLLELSVFFLEQLVPRHFHVFYLRSVVLNMCALFDLLC